MDKVRDKTHAPVLPAIAAVLLALVLSCAAAVPAHADASKHAIPALGKAVSADGGSYGAEARASAGAQLRYRLEATMPENVADLDDVPKVDYTVVDKPANGVVVDLSSVTAEVRSAAGASKGRLSVACSEQDGKVLIRLGDVRKACDDLAFGDVVVVDYRATLAQDAAPGTYENVAKLTYDLGKGPDETVGVMARVIVAQPAKALPQTGDALARGMVVVGMIALAAAGIVVAAGATSRSGKRKDKE